MEFPDAFTNLVYSYEYSETISPADGERRTSIIDLPVEMLFLISQDVRYSDLYSFIRVNKTFHIIGIQRLYTTIPLYLKSIKFSNSDAVQNEPPLEQLLDHLNGQPSRILRGLFARQEHVDAVRTLILCGVPEYSSDAYPKLLDTLLQGIFHSCTNIQTLCIKGRTQWYWYPLQTFASLNGITFPESLSTVRLDEMSTLTQTLLLRVSSLTVLELQNWEKAESLDQIPPGLGASLVELRCTWDFYRATESFEDFSRRFVTLVPSLRRLSLGFQNDDDGHMNSDILNAYLFTARNLHQLEVLTLLYFGHQINLANNANTAASEIETVRQFIERRPSLQRLVLHNYLYNGLNGPVRETITWKKEKSLGEAKEIWTPDPTLVSHWEHWFAAYVTADEVVRMMWKFWGEKRIVPSIDRLRGWEVGYYSARVNFKPLGW